MVFTETLHSSAILFIECVLLIFSIIKLTSLDAVSYTHLDVYKRQLIDIPAVVFGMKEVKDVYKRQLIDIEFLGTLVGVTRTSFSG